MDTKPSYFYLYVHIFLAVLSLISEGTSDYALMPGLYEHVGSSRDRNNRLQNHAKSRTARHDVWIEENQDAAFRHLAMAAYQPRRRHLERERLMNRMADDFDPFWMSVDRPKSDPVPHVSRKTSFNPGHTERLADLNFTYVDENNQVVSLKDQERKTLEKWLLQRASCPVYFTWMDLGVYFWPRWIRKGSCDTGQSCSWPAGMHCVPEQSRAVRILTWQCSNSRKRKKRPRDRGASTNAAVQGSDRTETTPTPDTHLSRHRMKRQSVRSDPRNARSDYRSARSDSLSARSDSRNARRDRNRDMRCKWVKTRFPITPACFCSC